MSTSYPNAFGRLIRISRCINIVLSAAFLLFVVLITTLIWGTERLVKHEISRLDADFKSLIDYILEQESFLKSLNQKNQAISQHIEYYGYTTQYRFFLSKKPLLLFEGKKSVFAIPFTLACRENSECTRVPNILFPLGAYLVDYYSTFWGTSDFPADTVFFVNEYDKISISIPSVSTFLGKAEISPNYDLSITEFVQEKLPVIKTQFRELQQKGEINQIIWLRPATFESILLGIFPSGFDESLWRGDKVSPKDIYTVSILSRERFNTIEREVNYRITHQFWLIHEKFGVLLGNSEVPEKLPEGISYTKEGLVIKLVSINKEWTGYYIISYLDFLKAIGGFL
ncbi:hypothetical protein PROVRETT_09502 [Providencia rettgeri DSM 1131]|uniref:hypothetical protein n=1 Tax=Providencia rettgeri TaxID=587 RepID=UPI000197C827|nr:hypothetical protein PROVRETT_09502 [Providencia rettgeri DSM 1131]QXA58882.1 hypothetical protein I6L79_04855 [Providencia rettgeri]